MNRWLILSLGLVVLALVGIGICYAQERDQAPKPTAPPPAPVPLPAGAPPGVPPLQPPGVGPGGGPLTPPGFPGAGRNQSETVKELIPLLIDSLKDADADVRTNSAVALANFGRDAIEPMLDIFKDKNQDQELRANVVQVFAQMGRTAEETLPALLKSLKDKAEDKEVRRRVSFAITRISKDMGTGSGIGGFPGAIGAPVMPGFPGGGTVTQEPVIKPADPGLVLPSKVREK